METLSGTDLVSAHRNIDTPFNLMVVSEGVNLSLIIRKILRLLPGKRIVALAECDGTEILIKTYLGRTATRYATREKCGVQAIARAGVHTPELLWHGKLYDGQGELLAFQYLKNATSLVERWEKTTNEEEQIDVLKEALGVIATLHNHGVVQHDLHLANFILSDHDLYTIDGGEVWRRTGVPLSEEESLRNLGLFFAQLYPKHDHLASFVLPSYEAIRGWGPCTVRSRQLDTEIGSAREARKQKFLQKVFRDCTRFACESSFRRYTVCDRNAWSAEVSGLLEDPDKWMANGTILKEGNTATVARVHLSDRSLVVKRYNVKNFWHGLRRAFRKSRAWHSWSNAWLMTFFGIPALKPVAMIESRIGPLRATAWLITEYIDGPDAVSCLGNMKNPDGELEALATILDDLAKAQISHGDLKATNFLMSEDGPIIIDLDGMREHRDRNGFEHAFGKDLDRFVKNWEDRPDILERLGDRLAHLPRQKTIN
ncbi:MAG: lipopolysaccharide kinase InaA family protein [Pseudomonadales bacterium]